MASYEEKRDWILEFMRNRGSADYMQYVSTFDEEFHNAYHDKFGGKINLYMIGPNIVPNANRTLRQMWERGDVRRKRIGNQDARQYMQPTWSLIYYLPETRCGTAFRDYAPPKPRRISFGRRTHKFFKGRE